ncbi:hypothetical protein CR513_29484 [Mucuna pruriens]|uniref:Secreted protein n=1 Tax=Mucuna pruriens TaxID=157652 RepID=A0A371GEB1_MUCPR|nr:hypothetical protein CR513_29484 [Mucuna pruriens]
MRPINMTLAFALSLRVLQVPVARTLVLVSVSPRWYTLALLTADPTELQASVLNPSFSAPLSAL